MTRMSPLERVLLRIEQQDYPMDTMGIYPLDPQADGLPFESVQALFAHRIATVPVLRRQISQTTYGLAEERWMQAAQVDLDHHLRRAVVPAPGNLRALLDLSLRLGQVPLDRRRPLWRAWYVEGLQDGGSALLVRTHHAMVDNLDGLALARHLLDDAPVAVAATPPPEFTGDPSPGALGMLGRAVPELGQDLVAAARQGIGLVRGQLRAGGSRRPLPPRTAFDRITRGPSKAVAVTSLPLDSVHRARGAHPGASTGDVLLALAAGALRRYLQRYHELPERPLRTSIPVAVPRSAPEDNPFTVMFLDLPVEVAEPAERLALVHRRNQRRRAAHEENRASTNSVSVASQLVHPGLIATMTTALGTGLMNLLPPLTNLTFAARTDPLEPLYFAGSRVRHVYGRTVVIPPQQVFLHAIIYDGQVDFGVTSLQELMPNPEHLMAMLHQELEELLGLVSPGADA